MSESETIDPRELNPPCVALWGDSVPVLVRTVGTASSARCPEQLNVERSVCVVRAQLREERPLFEKTVRVQQGRNASKASVVTLPRGNTASTGFGGVSYPGLAFYLCTWEPRWPATVEELFDASAAV